MNAEKTVSSGKKKRHIVLGILAHVDAGKTTLSESLLYLAGSIRKQGRVDHGDTFLDTYSMEKARGITIFSKQAELTLSESRLSKEAVAKANDLPASGDLDITLLDTPGHADFSPEMERTLSVLDYALLLVSAPDGVTGQVKTLWKLLAHYQIPAMIFVNKMDQPGMDRDRILGGIQSALGSRCVPLPDLEPEDFDSDTLENVAVCDDSLLEAYLDKGEKPDRKDITELVRSRKLFPVFFGSALKDEGVDALARGLIAYTQAKDFGEPFAAKIFKISRDQNGARLAYVRVLGGCMKAKMEVAVPGGEIQKIDQIRLYSGTSFETLREAEAGRIVCAVGLESVRAGQVLSLPGSLAPQAEESGESLILPVFRSNIILEEDTDPADALKNLRILEEEEPMLGIRYDSRTREISAEIMGQVETEIIASLCQQRFGMKIAFGLPSIVYRETIAAPVEGVGHYEPLRHYAEVHLLLEPAERGAGVTFDTRLSTDSLALNWQRLVLSSLMSTELCGVLTGSEITDMKVTLIGGRASEKHTEGGDFRQASIRALRQGLMSAESILLEPWYTFEAEVPQESIGRLMSDIQNMDGRLDPVGGDGAMAILTGSVPAAEVGNYAATVRAYTHGNGQITYSLKDYEPCRDPEKIILEKGYDPAADQEQPADSVFCSHGAGVIVPWNQVREHMHVDTAVISSDIDSYYANGSSGAYDGHGQVRAFSSDWRSKKTAVRKTWQEKQRAISAGEEELRRIFEQTYRGSSWNTPLHNSADSDLNSQGGLWSRDGSLERSQAGRNTPGRNAVGKTISGTDTTGKAPSGTDTVGKASSEKNGGHKKSAREDYLLVDGYNIIFAWPKLRELASINLDSAAGKLVEILSDYQGTQRGRLIIVFDAYRVHGGKRQVIHQGSVDIIYTKEAETADSYIMELTHTLADKGNVTVATGDGIVQMIIFSQGARRMSAAELKDRVDSARSEIREKYHTDR